MITGKVRESNRKGQRNLGKEMRLGRRKLERDRNVIGNDIANKCLSLVQENKNLDVAQVTGTCADTRGPNS